MSAKKKAKPKNVIKKEVAKKKTKTKKSSPPIKKQIKSTEKPAKKKLSAQESKLLGLANENKHVLLYGKDPTDRTILIREVHKIGRSGRKYKYVDLKRANGKVVLKKLTGGAGFAKVLEQDGTFFVDNLKCNDEGKDCYEELACTIENLKDRGITGGVWSVGVGGWLVVYTRNYKDLPEYFLEQFELVSLEKAKDIKGITKKRGRKPKNPKHSEFVEILDDVLEYGEDISLGKYVKKVKTEMEKNDLKEKKKNKTTGMEEEGLIYTDTTIRTYIQKHPKYEKIQKRREEHKKA